MAINIFEAQRAYSVNLRDIFSRLGPMEMWSIGRKYYYAAWTIGNQLIRIKNSTKANIKHPRHDGVYTIFRVCMRH